MNFNKLVSALLLSGLGLLGCSAAIAGQLLVAQAADACLGAGTLIDPITGNAPQVQDAVGTDCVTQPEVQLVTFYKIAVCTSQPTAPTVSTAVDLSSCSTYMSDAAGTTISVQLGATAPFSPSTVTAPPNNTYTWAYIELKPELSVQKTAYFDVAMYDTQPSANLGHWCWSQAAPLGTVYYNYSTENHFTSAATQCGLTPGVAAPTTRVINSFDGNGGLSAVTLLGTASHPINVYLVDQNGYNPAGASLVADAMGPVAKLIGILPINITVDGSTTGINVVYNNSHGATVNRAWVYPNTPSGLPAVMFFAPTAFDLNLVTTPIEPK